MSKVTASLKAILILSALIGTSAHAQFGGGRGPVTPAGFRDHRDRENSVHKAVDETNADKARYNAAADRIAERQRKGITPSAKDLAELNRLESVLKGSREAINRRLGQGGRLGAAAAVGSAVLGSSVVAGEAEAATAAEDEVQQAPTFSREEYRPVSRRHRVSK